MGRTDVARPTAGWQSGGAAAVSVLGLWSDELRVGLVVDDVEEIRVRHECAP